MESKGLKTFSALKQIKRARAAVPAARTAPNPPPLHREPTLPSSNYDYPSIHYHLTQKYTTSFTFNTKSTGFTAEDRNCHIIYIRQD